MPGAPSYNRANPNNFTLAMTDLSQFPITQKWQPRNASQIQLYSAPTSNGVKVSIMLEETGLSYEAHRVRFEADEQHSAEYLSAFPNGKIPAILDPDGPGGEPLLLFESGAILLYLAEKTGTLLPSNPIDRAHAIQWLMFQMSGLGPMFGQFGYFYKFDGRVLDDKRPLERYTNESRRLLGVLDDHLKGRTWMMGRDYSIADIAIFPWIRALRDTYGAGEVLELDKRREVMRVLENFLDRPAVARGVLIPGAHS